jgi:hypothetical protein
MFKILSLSKKNSYFGRKFVKFGSQAGRIAHLPLRPAKFASFRSK